MRPPIQLLGEDEQLTFIISVSDDPYMHINTAMFEQNARCGYVLKPPVFWDKNHALFNSIQPFGRDFEGIKPTTLTIHVGHPCLPHIQVKCAGYRTVQYIRRLDFKQDIVTGVTWK